MNSKAKIDKYALIYAIVITLLFTLGMLGYDRIIGEQDFDTGYIISLLFITIFLCLPTYFLSSYLFSCCDKIKIRYSIEGSDNVPHLLNSGFIIHACGMLIAWIPNLIIRFPGSYDADTAKMILQSYGFISASDHHPWFDTLVYGLFWKIGGYAGSFKWGLLLFVCFQMLLSATVFSYVISYMKRLGLSDKICFLTFLYYAVYPFFPTYTQKMVKDSFHGIFFTVFCLMFFHLFHTCGKAVENNKWITFCIFIGFLLVLTKKTGFYIFVISIVAALIIFKRYRRRLLFILIPVIVLSLLWNNIVLPLSGVAKGEQGEVLSVPSQQIALYIKRHPDLITQKDWSILRAVYNDPEEFADNYNPSRADVIKEQWREDSSSKEKAAFFGWYIKTALRHPKDMLLAVLALDYPLLYIRPGYESSSSVMYFKDEVFPDSGAGTGHELWLLDNCSEDTDLDTVHAMFVDTYRSPRNYDLSEKLFSNMYGFQNAFAPLFAKTVFAVWIPLFALICCCRTRRFRQATSLTPYILSTAVLAVGPIVLTRYMVCTVYTVPILLCSVFLYSGSEPHSRK